MQSQSLTELSMGVNAVKEDILRSESNRKSSEDERKSNEELRIDNEDVRITNEEARVKNEDTRLKSEEIRVSNEDTRERNENARKTNETTRVSNENKRITAESTRSSNENIRVNAENRRRNEHTARMAEIDEALANLPNSLPVANQTTLGGIKVGAGLSITADGILSATAGGTADSVNWENVVGKPTFATVATSGSYNDLTDKPTIPTAYTHPDTHPASMITGLSTVATSGSYNDLSNKPTIPTVPSSLPANGGNADTVGGYTIWTGTQTEYDALGTYSDTTIYMIKEG